MSEHLSLSQSNMPHAWQTTPLVADTHSSLLLDVWLDVIDHVQYRHDLSHLGRTCHALRSVVNPRLVGDGVMKLDHTRDLVSFAAFIGSGVGDCAQLVQSLELGLGLLDPRPSVDDTHWVESLVYILRCCTRAEHLHLYCPLLAEDHRIGEALADVTHIKYLTLDRASGADYLPPILSSMRSPCSVVMETEGSHSHPPLPRFDPIKALSGFTQTLETLGLFEPRLELRSVVYPHLATLSIDRWNAFKLEPLLRSFPGLRNLEIYNIYFDERIDVHEHMEDGHRAFNREISFMTPWHGLDSFIGTVNALYLLGVTRHIQCWRVFEPILTERAIKRFNACILDTRPTHLQVDLQCPEVSFPAIATTLAGGVITHLDIGLEDPSPGSMDGIIERLVQVCRDCKVSLLRLSISPAIGLYGPGRASALLKPALEMLEPKVRRRGALGVVYSDDEQWPTTAELMAAGTFAVKWQALRDSRIASRTFFAPIPTLRYAFLEMDQTLPLARENAYWEANPNTGRQLVPISADEAYKILRQEGMPVP